MPPVVSRVEVKTIGCPAVPRALIAPLVNVRFLPASNEITTPASMVSIAPFVTDTSAVIWYGLLANDHMVLADIAPDTLVAASVPWVMLIPNMTVSNSAFPVLLISRTKMTREKKMREKMTRGELVLSRCA